MLDDPPPKTSRPGVVAQALCLPGRDSSRPVPPPEVLAFDISCILFYSRYVANMPMASSPKTEQRDLFPGALEMMILRSVLRQPMHGYALVQHIKQRSNDLLQVEEGSLYPALQRLLKDGLLRADWEVSPSKRKVRTYRITPAGKKRLEREVSSFERMLEGITRVISPAES